MKRLFLLITLILFPLGVNAEECTDDKLKSYEPYVNSIVYDVRQLGDSDTYEVWASNVKGGIGLDHGRTVFDSGFLGYATAGEKFTVRVYVADGSVCAGTTIDNVNVKIPEPIAEEDECDSCEEEVTPPTIVEKPSTNTEVEKPSTNTEVEKPTTNTEVQKPSTNNSTTVEKPTNNSTTIEKPTTDNNSSKEEPSTNESVKEEDVTDEPLEDEIIEDSTLDEKQEDNNLEEVIDNNEVDKENDMNEVIIFIGVSALFVILVLVYSIIKKRNFK